MTAATFLRRHARRPLLLGLLGVPLILLVTSQLSAFQNYQLSTLGAYLCAAAGLTLLTGFNGQVSLGHAALMAVGAYTVALTQRALVSAGATGVWVLPTSLLAGTLAGALFGGVVGTAAARLHGPYLAGATLALGVAVPSIASYYSEVFKGDQGLFVVFEGPPPSLGADFPLERWQAWISLFAALVVLVLLANLSGSAVGRDLRAVRDNEIAAALAGLPVARIRVTAFAVSSATAGLGGGVFAVSLQNASPGSFSITLSLMLLAAVVIGGLGSLTGAVLGSVVVVYLGVALTDLTDRLPLSAAAARAVHDNLPPAVFGLLLVVVMRAMPSGLHGLLRLLATRLTRRGVSHRSGGQ